MSNICLGMERNIPHQPAHVELLGHVAISSNRGSTTIAARPAVILATLALERGPVSTNRLVDLLWDDPPRTALNALQRHVSRLRPVLQHHGARDAIRQSGGAYYLDRSKVSVDIDHLDVPRLNSAPRPIRWWLEPLATIDHIHFVGDKWRLQQRCDRIRDCQESAIAVVDIPDVVVHELTRWLDLRAAHDETASEIRTWLESVARPTVTCV